MAPQNSNRLISWPGRANSSEKWRRSAGFRNRLRLFEQPSGIVFAGAPKPGWSRCGSLDALSRLRKPAVQPVSVSSAARSIRVRPPLRGARLGASTSLCARETTFAPAPASTHAFAFIGFVIPKFLSPARCAPRCTPPGANPPPTAWRARGKDGCIFS